MCELTSGCVVHVTNSESQVSKHDVPEQRINLLKYVHESDLTEMSKAAIAVLEDARRTGQPEPQRRQVLPLAMYPVLLW